MTMLAKTSVEKFTFKRKRDIYAPSMLMRTFQLCKITDV